ncbi:MAG: sensor histidine kinase [Massiliimalia sp.]|jgi:two-component system sensor histidine kinase YesM
MKSIKAKIAVCMTLLILCSSVAGWLGVYEYFTHTLLKNEVIRHQEIVNTHLNDINDRLESIEEYGKIIAYNVDIQENISLCQNLTGYEQGTAMRDLSQKMSNYVILRPEYIRNMYVVNSQFDEVLSFSGNFNYDLQQLRKIIDQPEESQFTTVRLQETFSPHQIIEVISYIQPVYNLQNSQLMGYLVINMAADQIFDNAYQEYMTVDGYYLTDAKQSVIMAYPSSGMSYVDATSYDSQGIAETKQYYYLQKFIPKLNIWINVAVSKRGIQEMISGTAGILMIIIGVSLAAGIILSVFLGHSLTKPIIRLTKHMKIVASGSFVPMAEPRGQDEISQMTKIFNRMIQQIKFLMEKNNQSNELQKELTVKLFLSKINPHFIYNTLNCTIYLARRNQCAEIIQMTTALIYILRKNVEINERNVTIQEEIEYLKNYVEILKYRYNHVIELQFLVPQEFYQKKIPPLILYPIVENSIFHGITAKDQDGRVVVSVSDLGDHLLFSVEDDGVGIEPEKLQYIHNYLKDETIRETSGNIGLWNVHSRLTLYYGEASGLQIKSRLGHGTKIQFIIPK